MTRALEINVIHLKEIGTEFIILRHSEDLVASVRLSAPNI